MNKIKQLLKRFAVFLLTFITVFTSTNFSGIQLISNIQNVYAGEKSISSLRYFVNTTWSNWNKTNSISSGGSSADVGSDISLNDSFHVFSNDGFYSSGACTYTVECNYYCSRSSSCTVYILGVYGSQKETSTNQSVNGGTQTITGNITIPAGETAYFGISGGGSGKGTLRINSLKITGDSIHSHSFGSATCTQPATCSCGATSGSALGHNPGSWTYVNDTDEATYCTRCSARTSIKNHPSLGKVVIYPSDKTKHAQYCSSCKTYVKITGHSYAYYV